MTKPKRPISEEEAVETALGVRVPDCTECKHFKQEKKHKPGGSGTVKRTCAYPSNEHVKLPMGYTELLYPGIHTNQKNDCPFFTHKRKRTYVNSSSGR